MRRVLSGVLLIALSTGAPAAPSHPIDRATELLTALVPHVEAACGATFTTPPRAVVLDVRAAEQAFADDLGLEIAKRYPRATEGQRATLVRTAARSSVASCLARYSASAGAVILVRKSFDVQREAAGFPESRAEDLLRAVLAHEAVHALDDQRFDLAALFRESEDLESLRARAMVVEGRAVHFGRHAALAAKVPRDATWILPGGEDPRGMQTWTLRLTYELGAGFVGALVDREGRDLADRAMREPPRLTHQVCQPERWPDATDDARAGAVLRRAGLDDGAHAVSELHLRARYTDLLGAEQAALIFAGYRGGAQVLTDRTNAAVLAFVDAEAAHRYVAAAAAEAPTKRRGSVVVRAFGDTQHEVVERLLRALGADD